MAKYTQGFFKPKNPKKYKGNPTNIIYRSSYELKYMLYLDDHPDVLEWQSEEFFIPYFSPVDKKYHRYFIDFWVKKKNKDNEIEILLVEIKPERFTKPPKQPPKLTKNFIKEAKNWVINSSKWEATEEFCKKKGWTFIKITEKDLKIGQQK